MERIAEVKLWEPGGAWDGYNAIWDGGDVFLDACAVSSDRFVGLRSNQGTTKYPAIDLVDIPTQLIIDSVHNNYAIGSGGISFGTRPTRGDYQLWSSESPTMSEKSVQLGDRAVFALNTQFDVLYILVAWDDDGTLGWNETELGWELPGLSGYYFDPAGGLNLIALPRDDDSFFLITMMNDGALNYRYVSMIISIDGAGAATVDSYQTSAAPSWAFTSSVENTLFFNAPKFDGVNATVVGLHVTSGSPTQNNACSATFNVLTAEMSDLVDFPTTWPSGGYWDPGGVPYQGGILAFRQTGGNEPTPTGIGVDYWNLVDGVVTDRLNVDPFDGESVRAGYTNGVGPMNHPNAYTTFNSKPSIYEINLCEISVSGDDLTFKSDQVNCYPDAPTENTTQIFRGYPGVAPLGDNMIVMGFGGYGHHPDDYRDWEFYYFVYDLGGRIPPLRLTQRDDLLTP
jgi:hypothetical protein